MSSTQGKLWGDVNSKGGAGCSLHGLSLVVACALSVAFLRHFTFLIFPTFCGFLAVLDSLSQLCEFCSCRCIAWPLKASSEIQEYSACL